MPIVGDLIRQVPGTISLGQGVVHYGPPPAAIEAARAAPERPATHAVPGRPRPAGARRPDRAEAAPRERHRRRDGRAPHGDGRRQHGVHARRAGDRRRRATRSSCRCRSTSTTRWRSRWPAAAPSACRPTSATSCASTRFARAHHRRARAPSSRSRRTIRAARCSPSASLRDGQRPVPRPRHLSHHRRGLRVLHLRRRRATCRPASFAGRRGSHHLAVFAVEGVRLRRLAHRLHGVSRARSRRR